MPSEVEQLRAPYQSLSSWLFGSTIEFDSILPILKHMVGSRGNLKPLLFKKRYQQRLRDALANPTSKVLTKPFAL